MRLTDLVGSEDELKPLADRHYVLIRRETGATRRVSVVSADLAAAFASPASAANVPLQARDQVHVFDLATSRESVIASIMEDLQRQSGRDEPLQVVSVGGSVKVSGQYPLEAGMMVSDLLRAGGGLNASAYAVEAELTRYVIGTDGERQTRLVKVDLSAVRNGDAAADLPLQPYDYLSIKSVPLWAEQINVEVRGEVRFPGSYPVRRGETLSSVIARAGGLTDHAFPDGTVFTRESLKQREAEQIQVLANRLQSDVTSLALESARQPNAQSQQAYSVGQSLLEQLRATKPTGRLVIDLAKVLASPGDSNYDIALHDGDKLLVPDLRQEVTVLGEVQFPTSHLYSPSMGRNKYISLSGGLTVNADAKRIYVVRANGAVISAQASAWLRHEGSQIRTGDTIIVPPDTDRVPKLTEWASITQIIFNLAVAVAAIARL
jgi:protein involved in polysaccharide export with SLBB domain